MGDRPQLSIVIPAYNEAGRLPGSLATLSAYLSRRSEPWEVLIVVEKSPDQTLELATRAASKQANFRVIENEVRRGKGNAVRKGMLAAGGELIFYMDADLSVPVEEIDGFVKYARLHPETAVFVGNRQHKLSRIEKRQSLARRTMGGIFNRLIRGIVPVKIRDTQCGFKAFRRTAALAIFGRLRIDGFAFDVEALVIARQLGFQVADLPVRWINSEATTVHLFRDSFRMLCDVLALRLRPNP